MITLADILSAGATLPEEFLTHRRSVMVSAADREFRGSTLTLPEMPDWPGIWVSKGDTLNHRLNAMQRRTDAANAMRRKAA